MSLKSRLIQLSSLGVAVTTLFAVEKDKEHTDIQNKSTVVAPANLPESTQTATTENPPSTISDKRVVNSSQTIENTATPSLQEITTEPSIQKQPVSTKDPNRKMTKEEVSQFMQSEEYKQWRDKLGERWLLGMSGSVSEGFCPWCYTCTKGILTIGHGLAATNGMDFSKLPLYFEDGTKMTQGQVKQYLRQVTNRKPKPSQSKQVAHSVTIDGKPAKIAGIKYKDSLSLALTEVRNVIDTIYSRSYNEKGIDFMKEPYAVQILAVDIGYQVGPDNFVAKWKNFLSAVQNKQYDKLIDQVGTKERADGKRNNRRHQSKLLLAQLSEAQAQNDRVKSHNIVNELYAVGANIYNLKFRAVHNPNNPNRKLKKRDVGGFPADIQKMFNIDAHGNPIVAKTPKTSTQKARSNNKQRKNNTSSQKRRRSGGR